MILIRNIVTRTYPVVFHANGHSKWLGLDREEIRSRMRFQAKPRTEIAVWNGSTRKKCMVEKQLEHIPHQVISRGMKWSHVMMAKLESFWTFKPLLSTDYVLFLDGFDILLNGSTDSILDVMKRKRAKVLCAAETNSYPRYATTTDWERAHCPDPNDAPFLNGGCIFIQVEAFPDVIRELKRQVAIDTIPPRIRTCHDQYIWKRTYQALYPMIQIDQKREVFLCLNRSKKGDIQVGIG